MHRIAARRRFLREDSTICLSSVIQAFALHTIVYMFAAVSSRILLFKRFGGIQHSFTVFSSFLRGSFLGRFLFNVCLNFCKAKPVFGDLGPLLGIILGVIFGLSSPWLALKIRIFTAGPKGILLFKRLGGIQHSFSVFSHFCGVVFRSFSF